jgi:hypothetical protein
MFSASLARPGGNTTGVASSTDDSGLAARYFLPTIYPWRFFAELGGLLSYGNDQRDLFQLAATYPAGREAERASRPGPSQVRAGL